MSRLKKSGRQLIEQRLNQVIERSMKMTREEAIKELKQFSGTTQLRLSANFWEALNMAIKALEQEPKSKIVKMRDATPEERESIDKYIKSISTTTGVDFWDLEPSEDAISRQALISDFPISDSYSLDDIIATIKFQPSVTPTRKKGKWIKGCTAITGDGLAQTYDCSECGSYWYRRFKYCPNCGAEMESEE